MKFDILKKIIIPVAIAGSLVSCKDKDEDKILPSLEGKITFEAPEYIAVKGSLTMTPKGGKHPNGGTLGYSWKVSPIMKKADTTRFENGLDKHGKKSDGTFTYTFPDTLGTFTINAYAYASGFSGIVGTNVITTLDKKLEGSITGRGIKENDPHITTPDGQKYYYTTIGGKDWFKNNLNANGGIPYRKSLLTGDVFGKFYSYEEAKNACPQGWRLPTEADWMSLAQSIGAPMNLKQYSNIPDIANKLMANAKFNTKVMWEYWREVGEITNESGMAMIPVGFANLGAKDNQAKTDKWLDLSYPDAEFKGMYDYAAFWTADSADADNAYYRYLHVKSSEFKIGKADKRYFGASVRCVRDRR